MIIWTIPVKKWKSVEISMSFSSLGFAWINDGDEHAFIVLVWLITINKKK